MRWVVAGGVLVGLLASGCATPGNARRASRIAIVATAGTGSVSLGIAGFAAIASAPWSDCGDGGGTCDTEGLRRAAVAFSTAGVALSVVGLVIWISYEISAEARRRAARPPREEVDPVPQDVREQLARNRERAWALTKDAGRAARSGDCARVRNLGRDVRHYDADFHATVFMRDVAIASCFETNR
jgi:hypothetical protein